MEYNLIIINTDEVLSSHLTLEEAVKTEAKLSSLDTHFILKKIICVENDIEIPITDRALNEMDILI